jgi:2-keto-3-deoxy-L-rhamnonate aldolase RhmA
MRNNRVLEKLRQGRAALVTTVTPYASPKLTEMIGLLDFDCVWIDMEHQDYSYDQLFDMALGCRASGAEPMARIRKGDYWTYSRPFEAGATGIMVPHCRSGAEAEQIVRFSRFAPHGMRGIDGVVGVAQDRGAYAHHKVDILVAVQIPKATAFAATDIRRRQSERIQLRSSADQLCSTGNDLQRLVVEVV